MIDWAQVKSLRDDVGSDEFQEIIELFLEEVEEVITKLRDHPDITTLESDMHFLKGSALNLGFSSFSQMCLHGEKMSANGNAIDVNIPELLTCFDTSKSTFMTDIVTTFQ